MPKPPRRRTRPDLASLHGRRAAALVGRVVLHAWLVAALTLLPAWGAWANPQGGRVVAGQAEISSRGSRLDVDQSSHKAIIEWKSFDIQAGEHTHFSQPSARSIALNRIPDPKQASRIPGRLSADGNVWVINKLGVVAGRGSEIDVQGLLLSSTDIRNEDFLAGHYDFSIPGAEDARVLNQGTIRVGEEGLAALVAPWVRNEGVIHARLGRAELAAGERFTLDLYGDGLVELALSREDGSAIVEQLGTVEADGGVVLLSAADAKSALESVVNLEGVVRARSARQVAGRIVLEGDTVEVAGTLDAGADSGTGGSIAVLGDEIVLHESAELDVSGAAGGGRIRVGGDVQGRGALRTAEKTAVAAGASLAADATEAGDGGSVVVWADDSTDFEGRVSATGRGEDGDGGFAEVSGRKTLRYRGEADLSSESGRRGTLLLDPEEVVIGNGEEATLLATDLSRSLRSDAADVVVMAEGLRVDDAVDGRGGAAGLVLDATSDVALNDDILNGGGIRITSTGGGIAMETGDPDSFVTQGNGTVLFSETGDIHLSASDDIRIQFAIAEAGSVSAEAGATVSVERLVDTRSPGGTGTGAIELAGGGVQIGGSGLATDRGDVRIAAGADGIAVGPESVVFSEGDGAISAESSGDWSASGFSTEGDVSLAATGSSTLTLTGVVESRGAGTVRAEAPALDVQAEGRLLSNGGAIDVAAGDGGIQMALGEPLAGDPDSRDTGFDAGAGRVDVFSAGSVDAGFVNGGGGIELASTGGDVTVAGRLDARLDPDDPSRGGGPLSVSGQSITVAGELSANDAIVLESLAGDTVIGAGGAVAALGDAGRVSVTSSDGARLRAVESRGGVRVVATGDVAIEGDVRSRLTSGQGISVEGGSIRIDPDGRLVTDGGDLLATATTGSLAISPAPNSGVDAGAGGATLDAATDLSLGLTRAAGGVTATARGGSLEVAGLVDTRLDPADPSLGGGAIALEGDRIRVAADVAAHGPIALTSDVASVEIADGGRLLTGGEDGRITVTAETSALLRQIEASAGLSVTAEAIDVAGLLRETGGFGVSLGSASDTRILAGGRLLTDSGSVDLVSATGSIQLFDAPDTGIGAGVGEVTLNAGGAIGIGRQAAVVAGGGITATAAEGLAVAGLVDGRGSAARAVSLTGAEVQVSGEIANDGDVALTSIAGDVAMGDEAVVQSTAGSVSVDSGAGALLQNIAAADGVAVTAADRIDVIGFVEDQAGGIAVTSTGSDVVFGDAGVLESGAGGITIGARDIAMSPNPASGIAAGSGAATLDASGTLAAGDIAAAGGIALTTGSSLSVPSGAQLDARVDPSDPALGGGRIALTAQGDVDLAGGLVTAGPGARPNASVTVQSTQGSVRMLAGAATIVAGEQGSIDLLAPSGDVETANLQAGGGIQIDAGGSVVTRDTIQLAGAGGAASRPTLSVFSGDDVELDGIVVGEDAGVEIDAGGGLTMAAGTDLGIDVGEGDVRLVSQGDLEAQQVVASGEISLSSLFGDVRSGGLIDGRGGDGTATLNLFAGADLRIENDIASDANAIFLDAGGDMDLSLGRITTATADLQATAAGDVLVGEANVGGLASFTAGNDVLLTRIVEGGSLAAVAGRDVVLDGLERSVDVGGQSVDLPVATLLSGTLSATAGRDVVVDGFSQADAGITLTSQAAPGAGHIRLHRDLRTAGGDITFNGDVILSPAGPPIQQPTSITDRFGNVVSEAPLFDADRNPIGTGPAALDILFQLDLETAGGDVDFNGEIIPVAPVDDVFLTTIPDSGSDLATSLAVNPEVLVEVNENDPLKPRFEPRYVALAIDAGSTGNVTFQEGVATELTDLVAELPFPTTLEFVNDFDLEPPTLGALTDGGSANGETTGHARGTWSMRNNKALRIGDRLHDCAFAAPCIIPMPDLLLDVTAGAVQSTGDLFVGSATVNDQELTTAALSGSTPITGTGTLTVTGTLSTFADFSDAFNVSNSAVDTSGASTNVAGGNVSSPGAGGLSGNVGSPGGLGLGGNVGAPGSASLGGNVGAPGAGGLAPGAVGVGSQGIAGGVGAAAGLGDLPAQQPLPGLGGDDGGFSSLDADPNANGTRSTASTGDGDPGGHEEEEAEEESELAERCGASETVFSFQKTPAEAAFGGDPSGDPYSVDPFCAGYPIVASPSRGAGSLAGAAYGDQDLWSEIERAGDAPDPIRPLEAVAAPPGGE